MKLPTLLRLAVIALVSTPFAHAQTPTPAPATRSTFPGMPTPEERERLNTLSHEDHAHMLKQLGIESLRPGRNGSPDPNVPNPANYDEALANPYPVYPDALKLANGRSVATPEVWWKQRRPEIVEDFEREVYGRVPKDVPNVSWEVGPPTEVSLGGQPAVTRELLGHVDNRAHPEISVTLKASWVTPVNPPGRVPVLIMFGFGVIPGIDFPWPSWAGPEPKDPPAQAQLIAAGWGYVSLNTSSIQADNGAGLTQGIIGLTNGGARRKPEDWGALRAWAWGASRVMDFLETDPLADPRRVGIEGVSRYGKAALVAMAFDPRFAIGLISSSGEGGVKPHRRNLGEAVENLTGSGAYHWMAGNFIKYGAEVSRFGRKDANDLPVDAPNLIALCAPRPTFISYGVPERGDAKWLDQQGSYMATVAAGQVYRLLGARDLGDATPYAQAKLPPQGTELLEGQLAWRQHDGGHEDRSNMRHFIQWAHRELRLGTPVR